MKLKDSKTFKELKAVFVCESKTMLRYLYFAAQADIEGHSDAAAAFRSIANGELAHAHGHLEFIKNVQDPITGEPIGTTIDNLKSSLTGEKEEYSLVYPHAAKIAREEGFHEIADWFETLTKAEQTHEKRFQKELDKFDI